MMSTTDQVTQAVQQFAAAFSDQGLARELAGGFSCTEVEAIFAVLHTAGAAEAAQMWVEIHAEHDEPGDQHSATETEPEPYPEPMVDPMDLLQCDSCQ
ncbi:hypothetical protein [Schumannella soli]|uniref:Uncharacterized protein n=1 Tax=Schumannella soli TaxID=2590779 RepID=A0A506Y7Q6_9MICO|nr:hypothetical protein [Schumannella soli]TPW78065.1 hypothetical protein FJ657_05410 [Schumannella soli]